MKHTIALKWLYLAVFSLVLIGCGDSQDYVFTNTNTPGVSSRQAVLQFDYSDVRAQVPASVGGYRIEIYSSTGQQLSQQTVAGRVSQTTLTGVTTEAFVLRILGLSSSGTVLGYHDFSVPAGTESVTLRVDVLSAGSPPAAAYSVPTGQPAKLAFLVHPRNVDVGETFSVSVVVLDAAGYRVNNVSGSVNLSLTGSGALAGTTSANFSQGVATFSGLSVNSPGSDKFLTAVASGLSSGQSLSFQVVAVEPVEPVIEVPLDPQATTSQESPRVVSDSNGNFVVLWSDVDADAIVGRRLTPEGQAVGEEFTVATEASFVHDVAALPNGGFVVVWNPNSGSTLVQRFNANNLPIGTPAPLVASLNHARVAAAGDGSYVVTYGNLLVFAHRFDANGNEIENPISVNEEDLLNADIGTTPDVGVDQEGNFTVVWARQLSTGGTSVVGRRYDAAGVALVDIFDIATGAVGQNYTSPTIAMTTDGRSAVGYAFSDGVSSQILGRVFSSLGVGGSQFTVATTDSNPSYSPDITIHQDGTFALSWLRISGGDEYIWFARYSADGTLQGTVVRAGLADNDESSSRVAFAPNGTVAVVWHGYNGIIFNAYYSGFPFGTP